MHGKRVSDLPVRTRSEIVSGSMTPSLFRQTLLGVEPAARDRWWDLVLGLDGLPDDGPDLPRDGVPYLPCSVDVLLRLVDDAPVHASDVFVDIGSGLGRALSFVHLLTGARAVGIEVQRELVEGSRALAARLSLPGVTTVHGDASALVRSVGEGSVYFLYCPFSGARLDRFIDDLESAAATRALRICSVDLPLPERPWLELHPRRALDLAIYRAIS